MGRPSKKDQETKREIDRLREDVIKKFFGISDKIYSHIERAISATKPCMACSIVNGEAKVTKVGPDGLCAFCHGAFMVPDTAQRNWATERAQPIIAPSPKTIEMAVDQSTSIPELEEKVKALDQKTIDEVLKTAGILFTEETPNGPAKSE